MVLESFPLNQLSQLLDTNPNLPISAEKRRQVQDFRASQQLIQVFASQNKLSSP